MLEKELNRIDGELCASDSNEDEFPDFIKDTEDFDRAENEDIEEHDVSMDS
jgi:hypothetical protein